MIVSLLCFGGGIVLGSHFPDKILPVYQTVLGKSREVWYKNVLKTEPMPTGNGVSRHLWRADSESER